MSNRMGFDDEDFKKLPEKARLAWWKRIKLPDSSFPITLIILLVVFFISAPLIIQGCILIDKQKEQRRMDENKRVKDELEKFAVPDAK